MFFSGLISLFCYNKIKLMKKITILLVVITAALSFTTIQSCKSSGSASAAKMLKFNLEKGKGYDYDIVWDMNQTIMGKAAAISIGAAYSIRVDEDKDHIKTLTNTYKSFRMNMNMMGVTIDVDTDKPAPATEDAPGGIPTAMMNKIFSGIVGKTFTMKVDEEGKVLEVTGFTEMLQTMSDSMGLSDEMKQKMSASLKDQFNEQTVKDQFAQVFTIFPNKEIKVGDSWDKDFSMGGKMPAKYTTTYTVKEIEGDHVTLKTKTKIEGNGEMGINGEQTGTVIIDSKTGLMVNGEYEQDIQAKVQGMSFDMTGKGKIKGKAIN
jgi:Family of unknown function (DUF6263)